MSFLAYPDCDRCSGSGYITRASYDGHRTDYDQEQCPRCKKRRQADRNRHASRLLQGGGLELISESVELDSANQIVHTRVYKESTAPVLRAEQV